MKKRYKNLKKIITAMKTVEWKSLKVKAERRYKKIKFSQWELIKYKVFDLHGVDKEIGFGTIVWAELLYLEN